MRRCPPAAESRRGPEWACRCDDPLQINSGRREKGCAAKMRTSALSGVWSFAVHDRRVAPAVDIFGEKSKTGVRETLTVNVCMMREKYRQH